MKLIRCKQKVASGSYSLIMHPYYILICYLILNRSTKAQYMTGSSFAHMIFGRENLGGFSIGNQTLPLLREENTVMGT